MMFNKYLKIGMDAATAIFAAAASFDWSAITPTHAAAIAGGIATIRTIMSVLGPAPGSVVTTPKGIAKTA